MTREACDAAIDALLRGACYIGGPLVLASQEHLDGEIADAFAGLVPLSRRKPAPPEPKPAPFPARAMRPAPGDGKLAKENG